MANKSEGEPEQAMLMITPNVHHLFCKDLQSVFRVEHDPWNFFFGRFLTLLFKMQCIHLIHFTSIRGLHLLLLLVQHVLRVWLKC